jgi:hypothetical protein
MSVARRTLLGSKPRPFLAAATAALLAASTLSASTGTAEALTGPSPGTFAGRGFDRFTAPPQDVMTTWLTASPYRAVGIYIGGVNRFDQVQLLLTPAWVNSQRTAGWHLLPVYFGLQPPCTIQPAPPRRLFDKFTAGNAAASGRAAADDAVLRAKALGLLTGSTIFNDIEAYSTTDPVCRTATLTFQSAWSARLHDLGFLSGFYSSLGSGIRDQVAVYNSTAYVRPDYVWFARYDGVATVSDNTGTIPSTFWLHRRVKQYQSPLAGLPPLGLETYGGKTLSVDRNQVDVQPVPATRFGDFTGNGWSDVIVRQTSTGNLYLYPGNGTSLGARLRIGAGWNVMSAITRFGDFNRDGHEDLIARERATGALWLYRGTGTGFLPRLKIGRIGWNAMREITPVGDLNGDGFPDLLAVQTSTGTLFLYPGRGTGFGTRRSLGTGWNALSELTGVGDFNRDGRVDLIARQSSNGILWLYPGRATGLGPRVQVGAGWNSMRDLVGVGDFDRDGLNDLVAVENATGRLFRYPWRTTSFGPRVFFGSGWTSTLRPLL